MSLFQRIFQSIFGSVLPALIRKEFTQIRRDRRLAISLVIPPTMQLLLFGFALNATVDNLNLGIVDLDHTPQSRDLIAGMTESRAFRLGGTYVSANKMGDAISRNEIDAGLVIPPDFAKDLARSRQTTVQILLNAMNANTAAIAQGYSEGVLQSWNLHPRFLTAPRPASPRGNVILHPAFFFNPGLVSAWFIVTGTFGVLLMLNGSLIAGSAMIKERENGTVEQLLMTPATTTEIIVAKIAPLFVLLCGLILLATVIIRVVFGVPFRGNFLLVLLGAQLCVLCGIGIGTVIATFTRSAQQSQLMAFFVNPPLATLSGSLTPIEAMPHWLQPFTVINPLRHFGIISRSVLLRGSGLETVWPNFLALIIFTLVMMSFSVWRFRKQLG